MSGQEITFKTEIALKTFGNAVIYFDFEQECSGVETRGNGVLTPFYTSDIT